MPRSEKWLSELDAGRSTLDIAKEVLNQRLKAMVRLIGAGLEGGDDVEAVHDLRVWTRRTEAALVLFKPLIAKKRQKWVRKRLRRLRGVAGTVRDCDVHWKHLNDESAPHRALLHAVVRERKQTRKELQRVQKKLTRKHRFAKKARKLVEQLEVPADLERDRRSYRSFARQSLAEMASAFFQAADLAGADDEALHRLRIAAKRWRYGLELAASVLEKPSCSELYSQLSELQDRLGEVHDLEALCGRVESAAALASGKRRRARLQGILERQQGRFAERRSELCQWWTAARREQLAECWRRASGVSEGNRVTRG